jgi:starch phosphorylase
MLREYTERMYLPAMRRTRKVWAADYALARTLAGWKERLRSHWNEVRVAEVVPGPQQVLKVGDKFPMRARIHLGPISPTDVAVEAYVGPLSADGELTSGQAVPLKFAEHASDGDHWFEGAVPCEVSGRNGYAIRVLPSHDDLADRYDQGLVVWG